MDAKTLCLAVLLREPASGYEIKKTLEAAPFCHFQETGFGSIYPALTTLSNDGALDCSPLAQEKRPDKKVYSITAKGRQALVEALLVMPGPDRYRSDFLFILFLGDILPRSHLVQVVDQRISFYREQIARMAECDLAQNPSTQRFVHGFGLAIYQAAADYLIENRELLLAGASDSASLVAEQHPLNGQLPQLVP